MMTRALLLASALVVVAAACNDTAAPTLTSKSEAASRHGRGDDGSDLCLVNAWYQDGECDAFCVRPDPDCEGPVRDGGPTIDTYYEDPCPCDELINLCEESCACDPDCGVAPPTSGGYQDTACTTSDSCSDGQECLLNDTNGDGQDDDSWCGGSCVADGDCNPDGCCLGAEGGGAYCYPPRYCGVPVADGGPADAGPADGGPADARPGDAGAPDAPPADLTGA
jgi:hypothetical protein